jgi:hypothetical protein
MGFTFVTIVLSDGGNEHGAAAPFRKAPARRDLKAVTDLYVIAWCSRA